MPQTNADFDAAFSFQSADGTPLNLTGASVRMDVRKAPGAADAVLSLWPGAGIDLSEAATGRVKISVPHATMGAIAPGVYAFDMIRIIGAARSLLCAGSITIREGVTA